MRRAVLLLFFASLSGYTQTHHYQVIDLGVLPGQPDSLAFSINASGTVVGRSGSRPFIYKNCQMADLGVLPGGSSAIATAINNDGVVAGQAVGSDQGTHAVSWHDGSIHLLEAGNTYQSEAVAVSSPGKVIGYEFDGKVAYATAYVNDLPVVVPSDNDPTYGWAAVEVATGGNGSGQLIGYRPIMNSLNQFITMLGLITPPGSSSWVRITPPSGYSQSLYPWAINEDGAVAGWAESSASIDRAFLAAKPYSAASNLGTLGGQGSQAFALNNARWVVGISDTPTSAAAFLYDGTKMIDLNTTLVNGAGWQLTRALSINDYDQIVGAGIHNGQSHGFLLNPVIRIGLPIVPCLLPPIATTGGSEASSRR